ncbi:MAG: hypothetical protein E4H03_01700, partial [Myxococcales bacterium]
MAVLAVQPRQVERSLDQRLHLVVVERLLDVIERPLAHRRDSGRHGGVSRHEDHDDRRVGLAHTLQNLQTVAARHTKVGNQQIEAPLEKRFQQAGRIGERSDLVALTAQHHREDVHHVGLVVKDRDAGLHVAGQIFEPFFATKATGTGLGLPMAARIVEAHGGCLELVPGAGAGGNGRGACFRISLPVQAQPRMPG